MVYGSCSNLENELLSEVSITDEQFNSILEIQSVILEMIALNNEPKNILNKLCHLVGIAC